MMWRAGGIYPPPTGMKRLASTLDRDVIVEADSRATAAKARSVPANLTLALAAVNVRVGAFGDQNP